MVVKKKETRRTKCEAGEQQVLRTLPKEISTPPTGGPWPVCVSSPEDSGDFLQESLTVQYRRYMKAEIRFGKLGKYSSDLICAELRISISAHICREPLRCRHRGAESLRVDFHWDVSVMFISFRSDSPCHLVSTQSIIPSRAHVPCLIWLYGASPSLAPTSSFPPDIPPLSFLPLPSPPAPPSSLPRISPHHLSSRLL